MVVAVGPSVALGKGIAGGVLALEIHHRHDGRQPLEQAYANNSKDGVHGVGGNPALLCWDIVHDLGSFAIVFAGQDQEKEPHSWHESDSEENLEEDPQNQDGKGHAVLGFCSQGDNDDEQQGEDEESEKDVKHDEN